MDLTQLSELLGSFTTISTVLGNREQHGDKELRKEIRSLITDVVRSAHTTPQSTQLSALSSQHTAAASSRSQRKSDEIF